MWGDDPRAYGDYSPMIFLMYYLDDTSREKGCLRLLPGTHRRSHQLHGLGTAHTKDINRIDDAHDPRFADYPGEVDVPLQAGDLVVGDARLFHCCFHLRVVYHRADDRAGHDDGEHATDEVDFETRQEPYLVTMSHVNTVVPDTAQWEQSAAFQIDRHEQVRSLEKNAGLGFAIPHLHNSDHHEYLPDVIIQVARDEARYLILEIKGCDPLRDLKEQAAQRWVRAVNGTGALGHWDYEVVTEISIVREAASEAATARQ